MKELPKVPDFKAIEKKWQDWWFKNKIYKFNPNSKKPIYSIDTPPVYASAGHLHIGHALHYTQFEMIARFQRMIGKEVYFPPGYDDNGLPTEKYVEEKYKITKASTTKAKFRKLCLEESKKVEEEYTERVYKALGHSYDWDLLYTTISPQAQKIAQLSFIDLYDKGLVYKGEEPTLWCPYHQTALAQAETEDKERDTFLNYVDFELEDKSKINIATTRPELLPACVGIFVHPNDKRYKKIVGKKAKVPLFNFWVPIMTDEKVDPNFGSGIVMVCTFGDTTDIEWWRTHKLPLKIAVTKDGKLNELAGKYKGLNFAKAKEKIVNDLRDTGYLTGRELLKQNVGCCWRCGTALEYIVTEQWMIKTLKFKDKIIKQGSKVKWHPAFYKVRFDDWVTNLGWDWVISRQRFYGVPMPIWYCKKCGKEIVATKKQIPVDPEIDKPPKACKCGSKDYEPEHDVFDTWMTSSMTPQLAGKWLENPELYKKLYPFSLRPQSHDIIRTWAFYTILKSYLHFDSKPWDNIMIGTYVLDEKGRGMHKSKGNSVWFKDMYEKHKSVDSIRYWVATAGMGEDIPFQEKEIVRGAKIQIKLWNTARYVSMSFKDLPKKKPELNVLDKWILTKLKRTVDSYRKNFDNYDIAPARKNAELFFLRDFADNYLESTKYRIYGDNKASKEAAIWTLHQCLLGILKMFAPIIPHITEEIYQNLFKEKEKSIHLTELPKTDIDDKKSLEIGEVAINHISELRKWKQDNKIKLGDEVEKITIKTPAAKLLEKAKVEVQGTMRIKNLEIEEAQELNVFK